MFSHLQKKKKRKVKTSHHDLNTVGVTHLETEDDQAELTLSSNLKVRVTPQIGLKELCHLNALKKTRGKKKACRIRNVIFERRINLETWLFRETGSLLHVEYEPEGFSDQSSATRTRV